MKLRIKEIVNKTITAVIFCVAMVMTASVFYFLSLNIGVLVRENQTYNRYISCVLSVSSQDRTQSKINRCWIEVQKDTGVDVKRYDK